MSVEAASKAPRWKRKVTSGSARSMSPTLAGKVRNRMSRRALETVERISSDLSCAAWSARVGKRAVAMAMPKRPSGVMTMSQA